MLLLPVMVMTRLEYLGSGRYWLILTSFLLLFNSVDDALRPSGSVLPVVRPVFLRSPLMLFSTLAGISILIFLLHCEQVIDLSITGIYILIFTALHFRYADRLTGVLSGIMLLAVGGLLLPVLMLEPLTSMLLNRWLLVVLYFLNALSLVRRFAQIKRDPIRFRGREIPEWMFSVLILILMILLVLMEIQVDRLSWRMIPAILPVVLIQGLSSDLRFPVRTIGFLLLALTVWFLVWLGPVSVSG